MLLIQKLLESSRSTCQKAFNEAMLNKCREGAPAENLLDLIVDCATSTVMELVLAKTDLVEEDASEVDDRMEALRSVFRVAQESLERCLEPQLFFHLGSTSLDDKTTPRDAAKVIAWLTKYLDGIGWPEAESHPWTKHRQELVDICLDRGVRNCMRLFFVSSLKMETKEDDIYQNKEGSIATGYVADLTVMHNAQISVAKECLPSMLSWPATRNFL